MARRRGICSVCHRDISLRKNGTVQGHGSGDIYTPWCAGSLESPTALVENGVVYARYDGVRDD